MSIGNPVDAGGLNAKLGDVAVTMRQAMNLAQSLFAYVNKQGIPGLEALGMSVTDANAFFTAANQAQSIAGVYFGTVTQAALFNFDDALTVARGIN
jgi:hypothetical protein